MRKGGWGGSVPVAMTPRNLSKRASRARMHLPWPLPSSIPAASSASSSSNDEIARYSRHLIMPEVTLEGQKRLKAASVLCIGAGGLGSPIALYLAAAGVGRHGPRRWRHRRFFQSPAADPPRHEGRGPQEAELRARPHPRGESERAGRSLRRLLHLRERAARSPSRTTSSSTARTISRRATARTTSASS